MANILIALGSSLLATLKTKEPASDLSSITSDLKYALVKEGSMIIPDALEKEAEALAGAYLPTIFKLPDAALHAIAVENCDFAKAQAIRDELATHSAQAVEQLIEILRTPVVATPAPDATATVPIVTTDPTPDATSKKVKAPVVTVTAGPAVLDNTQDEPLVDEKASAIVDEKAQTIVNGDGDKATASEAGNTPAE